MATEHVDVLQVITSSARRGAELFALALQPELVARGMSVRTVALTDGAPPPLPVEALGTKPLTWSTLSRLRRETRSASAVVAHGSKTLPATFVATLTGPQPFVYRNIGDPYYWTPTRIRRARTRLMMSRAAAVVSLTAEAGRRISEQYAVPTSRITAIPSGISTEDFPQRSARTVRQARAALGIQEEQRIAICVGALSPEKDVVNAVRAMEYLPERWHLLIAGDGPDRGKVEAAASRFGDRVRLLGQISDPVEVMKAAEVLVVPSQTEGLPGVVIEAAMIGVPAICTEVGFVREIIQDRETGRIVPTGDPEAMARAVLECEPDLERLGQAANSYVSDHFSLATVADQWFSLLEPLVGRNRSSTAR